jgi:ribosome assembly protein YihI (activator of Der GTPase)
MIALNCLAAPHLRDGILQEVEDCVDRCLDLLLEALSVTDEEQKEQHEEEQGDLDQLTREFPRVCEVALGGVQRG